MIQVLIKNMKMFAVVLPALEETAVRAQEDIRVVNSCPAFRQITAACTKFE